MGPPRDSGRDSSAALAFEVVARRLVAARAGHDHAVKGGVDLAVAALIEAMALRVARAPGDRRDAGDSRDLRRCREALGAGDLADEVGGDQRPEPGLAEQLRRDLLDEDGDVALELIDRGGQLAQAAQQLRPEVMQVPAVELDAMADQAARSALVIIAEIGADMSVCDPQSTSDHGPASAPANDRSAGKRRSGHTRNRSRWLGVALTEAALAATSTKNT